MSLLNECKAVLALFCLTGWFYILPLLAVGLLLGALRGSMVASSALAIFISSAFWPTGGYWEAFCRSHVFLLLQDYFRCANASEHSRFSLISISC